MCGIAGLIARDGHRISRDVLDKLASALAHRGPDGHAIHINGNVGLVHTRLAIIDVQRGMQPFVNAQGVALIANGEIYNDLELRKDFPSPYKTDSDCESALRLYERAGEAFAKSLRGMYAIAIHDPMRRIVALARDPFGIKPLYYAQLPHGLCFASEPQALIAAGLVAPKINPAARDELLALQFAVANETAFAGIHRLRPGETLIIENGAIVRRHQLPWCNSPSVRHQTIGDAVAAVDQAWADSVRLHRRSDVPYGMFLSGGIDSTALLAMMARQESQPVVAYTATFPETSAHDESALAAKMAQHFGAQHVTVGVTAQQFWARLPAIAAAMDDPVADYAIIPSFLLAERAAKDVKVILTGEGGDELFAGYGRYRSAMRPWPFTKTPWSKHGLAKSGVLRDAGAWRASMAAHEARLRGSGFSKLQRAQALDIETWLPNDLLLKVDRCLMHHAIEGRVPFLDYAIADVAFPLADRFKIQGRLGKHALRHWVAKAVQWYPAFQSKRGFSVPVGEWIVPQAARLAPLVARQPGLVEVSDPARVEAFFRQARPQDGPALWLLLFYALWHNRHILGRSAEADVFSALEQV
jgi:asparagine synthase (glutamine-hydrolysing)